MSHELAFIGVLAAGIGGGFGVYAAALALGIRHGIDWDHIAAITDITSATSSVSDPRETWLIGEPGLQITDESHHAQHGPHDEHGHRHALHSGGHHDHPRETVLAGTSASGSSSAQSAVAVAVPPKMPVEAEAGHHGSVMHRLREHKEAVWLGTLYALGHGLVVTVLGVIAIVASEFLPDWVDGVMERVVGFTLIFLAAYLFFSIYQYYRGGGEFRIRSRWMLVFAGVQNAWHWVRSRLGHHEHVHAAPQQYGARTAFGIGLIHGIGAETGTQALIIATAVGATSKPVAIAALVVFVMGLLISNSIVTVATTAGFVSSQKRQSLYVAAGLFAAIFSLVLGLLFINAWTNALPDLDQYFRWVGGPS